MKEAWAQLNADFSVDELYHAKERMHKGRAGGVDGLPIELFLGFRVEGKGPLLSCFDAAVLDLFNSILLRGKYPLAWRIAMLVPIFKNKGSPLCTDNYRGISLLSALSKFFATILETRLSNFHAVGFGFDCG